MQLSSSYFEARKLENLVENQTSFSTDDASMHIFETHQKAQKVQLTFDNLVLASMIEGRKHMHRMDKTTYDFVPGETVIMPAERTMCIDFPDAQKNTPTRCLALELNKDQVSKVVHHLNETQGRLDGSLWQADFDHWHFKHDQAIQSLVQRLIFLFTENHPSKDFFVRNMIQELIIRLLQQANRENYLEIEKDKFKGIKRIEHVSKHIRTHLSSDLSIEKLSSLACMSSSHFYKAFKNETGLSPTQFINKVRVEKAMSLLRTSDMDLTEVYMACGFNNRSYFNRMFKRYYKRNPGEIKA